MKFETTVVNTTIYKLKLDEVFSKVVFLMENDIKQYNNVSIKIPYIGMVDLIFYPNGFEYHGQSAEAWLKDPYFGIGDQDHTPYKTVYNKAILLKGSRVYLPVPLDYEIFKKVIYKLVEIHKPMEQE